MREVQKTDLQRGLYRGKLQNPACRIAGTAAEIAGISHTNPSMGLGHVPSVEVWLRHLPATLPDCHVLIDFQNVVLLFYKDSDSGPLWHISAPDEFVWVSWRDFDRPAARAGARSLPPGSFIRRPAECYPPIHLVRFGGTQAGNP